MRCAGDIGHTASALGPVCECGNCGCLQLYGSILAFGAVNRINAVNLTAVIIADKIIDGGKPFLETVNGVPANT